MQSNLKEVKKCNKCDERGMIVEIKNGAHYGHSCDCGYDNYLMKKRFENVSIEDLLNYGIKRIHEKSSGSSSRFNQEQEESKNQQREWEERR